MRAGAHLRARTVQRTRSEWACRSCAAVSSRLNLKAAAGAPGDADVVVDAGGGGWAACGGGKGRQAGGAQLGRHRCAGAGTAKGQGHGWGVQWLAGGWLAAGAVQLERMSSGLGVSADPSIAAGVCSCDAIVRGTSSTGTAPSPPTLPHLQHHHPPPTTHASLHHHLINQHCLLTP